MEDQIDDLVGILLTTINPDDILLKITKFFQELDLKSYSSLISNQFCSLHTLEQWAWKTLGNNKISWLNGSNYFTLFQTFATFNKNLVFLSDVIEAEKIGSLLIPGKTEYIDKIFEQITPITDENNSYIHIISYWLDNLSYLIGEHTQFIKSPIVSYLNNSIATKYVMTDQYKYYLKQLQKLPILQRIFTIKQLFYLRTCSFSLSCFFFCKKQTFPFTSDEILDRFGQDYLNMIHIHSENVSSWSEELLCCITHVTNFMCNCHLWRDNREKRVKIMLTTEEIAHEQIQSLVRIISYKPFHSKIESFQSNDYTVLIDTILHIFLIFSEDDDLLCYTRTETNLYEILLLLTQNETNSRINVCSYGLLGELLCDQKLKELQIPENACKYFFYTLEKAWKSPAQKYQRSAVVQLLRGKIILFN